MMQGGVIAGGSGLRGCPNAAGVVAVRKAAAARSA
jgi:hypothetical protein